MIQVVFIVFLHSNHQLDWDSVPSNFNELFAKDVAYSLNVSTSCIVVRSVISLRALDIEVGFDVELEDSGYEDPDELEQDMTDLVNDPTSTLYQGNITCDIDPTSFEVVGVFIANSSSSSSSSFSSSSSSLSSSSSQSSSSLLSSASSSEIIQDSSSRPAVISQGHCCKLPSIFLPTIIIFAYIFVLKL